jgi:hypothetical protein
MDMAGGPIVQYLYANGPGAQYRVLKKLIVTKVCYIRHNRIVFLIPEAFEP